MTVLFITCSFGLKSQEDYETIKSTFDAYRLLIEQKEYHKAFDYYLDSFLVYIPKEQLIKQFSELDHNPNIEYRMSDSKISFISEIIEDRTLKKYALVCYTSSYHYHFKEGADEEYRDRIKNLYQSQHGRHYSFSDEEQTITLQKNGELIAIKKDDEWGFIIYQERLKPYMSLWMPQPIFNELLMKKESQLTM